MSLFDITSHIKQSELAVIHVFLLLKESGDTEAIRVSGDTYIFIFLKEG